MLDNEPAVVRMSEGTQRQIWMTGMPALEYYGDVPGSAAIEPTANIELVRRLLIWLGQTPPLVRLDPFPPMDDYRRLRPRDRRAVPTVELLPMVDASSILAIVFPYTPVHCETALLITPPEGDTVAGIDELWHGGEWTAALADGPDGGLTLPLSIPGDSELLAFRIRLAPGRRAAHGLGSA